MTSGLDVAGKKFRSSAPAVRNMSLTVRLSGFPFGLVHGTVLSRKHPSVYHTGCCRLAASWRTIKQFTNALADGTS